VVGAVALASLLANVYGCIRLMTMFWLARSMMQGGELHNIQSAEHIMGMSALRQRRWTAADVRAIPGEWQPAPRYELLEGELLVTPSPGTRHQLAVRELLLLIHEYCRNERVGEALMSPSDIELRPDTIVQPDIFVIPSDLVPADGELEWPHVTRLALAVEVISPSSVRTDRVVKRDFYLANGVAEYWIVDPGARIVERWTPEQERPDIRHDTLEWHPPGASSPLRIDLHDFFGTQLQPRAIG
jgi:Uma2 family endonuclease